MVRRSRLRFFSLTAVALFLSFFAAPLFAASSSIMPSSGNYLVVTDNTGAGTLNTFAVFFLRIPTTIDKNTDIILAMNSPGGSTTSPDAGYSSGSTYVSLYGGTGAYSDVSSKALTGTLSSFQVGTLIGSAVQYTNETTGWYAVRTIKPSWGEQVGNYYYFKIIVDVSGGNVGKNAFQFDVSYSTFTNGTTTAPAGISGVNFFAYSIPYLLLDATTYNLYPFVPYGTAGGSNYLHIANWDMDVANLGTSTTGTLTSHLGSSSSYTANLSDNGNWSANASSLSTVGEDNATWNLSVSSVVTASNTNPAQFWAWVDTSSSTTTNNGTAPTTQAGIVPIYFSAISAGPVPDHVLSTNDGVAVKTSTGTGLVNFTVVDSSGSSVSSSTKIWVTLSNLSGANGAINSSNNSTTLGSLSGTTYLLTTDGFGNGWIRVTSTTTGSVVVSATTDGTNGSTNLTGSASNTSGTVTFVSVTPPTVSSGSNQSFNVGAASTTIASVSITENDSSGAISSGSGLRIRITGGLSAQFDTSVTSLTASGTAQSGGHIAAAPSVTTTTSLITIPVISTFGNGQIATLAGIKLMNFTAASSGQLQVSWDGGTTWSTDSSVITIVDTTQTTWTNGAGTQAWATSSNWSNGVPTTASKVTIPTGLASSSYPIVPSGTQVTNLTIASGAEINLQGNNLIVTGVFSNDGTVYLYGTSGQTVTLPSSTNDIDSGTWSYNGSSASDSILDFGTTDYYNLVIGDSSTVSTSATLAVANNMTVSSGTFSIGHAITVAGNFSWSGATAVNYTAGSGVTLTGSSKTLTPGTATINSALTIQAGASYTLAAALITSTTLTIPGTLATAGNNISVAGNLDFSTTGAFTAGTGTVTMASSGTGRTLTTNGVSFYNLTLSNGTDTTTLGGSGALNVTNTLTINSNQTLDVGGNNFTIATLDNNTSGVLSIDGTQATQTITTPDVAAGAVLYKGTSGGTIRLTSFYDLNVDVSNSTAQTYTLNGTTTVAGALTINYGTLAMSSFNLTVTGAVQIGDAVGSSQMGLMTQTTGVLTANSTTTIDVGTAVNLTLSTTTNDFVGTITVESALNLTLSDTNGISFSNSASTITGNLSLSVAGAVSQGSASVDVGGNLTISTSAASTSVTLTLSTNTIAGQITLSVTGAGTYNAVSITSDSAAVTLNTLASITTLTLNFSAAGIAIPSGTSVSGTMTLTAGSGTITDAASFSAGTLVLTASGLITLDGASNTIGTLGTVSRGGAFTLVDSAGGLTLTGPVTAGTTTNNVSIQTAGGALAVNGNVTAGTGGTLSLTGVGITVASSITLSGTAGITFSAGTGTLTLNSSDSVTSSTTGTIVFVADDMSISATATVSTGSGAITLRPSTNSQLTYVGTGASGLGLSSTEIDRFSTTGTMHIGLASTTTGNIRVDGGITTSGTKSLSFETTGSILVDATSTINTSTGGGSVTLDALVDASGAFGLTITAGAGAVAFNYAVGSTLSALTVSSAATTTLKAVTTTGAQSYTATTSTTIAGTLTVSTAGFGVSFSGPALLSAGGGTITLTGSNAANDVTFGSTLSGAQTLAITATGGDVSFNNTVGSTALTSISVTSSTVAAVASITTTGAQSYTATTFTFNPSAALTMQTTNSNITFSGAVSIGGSANTSILTTGATASTPTISIGSINFTAVRTLDINGGIASTGLINIGTVTAPSAGTLQIGLNTNTASTSGKATLSGDIGTSGSPLAAFRSGMPVTLSASIAVHTTGALRFVGTIDGTAQTEDLVLAAGGTVTLSNNIGMGANTRIAKLTVNGSAVNLGNAGGPAGPFTIRTNDDFSVISASPATLNQAFTIDTSNQNKAISFSGTLSGAQILSLAAGTGAVSFTGTVGGTALTSLTVTSAGTISLPAVTTVNAQSYTASTSVTLNGTLTTNTATAGVGTVSFPSSTAVILGATVTINTSASNAAISFGGTLNATNTATEGLTLTLGTGTATATGAVGLTKSLGAVVVTGGTFTLANTDNTFGSSVTGTGTLGASAMNSSRTLTIGGNIGSAGTGLGALSAPTSGALVANGTVWNVTTFTANSSTVTYSPAGSGLIYSSTGFYNLTTTGTVGYNGSAALTVNNDLNVSSGTLTLVNASGTVTGNLTAGGTLNASAITGANTLTITGSVGTAGTPVATLTAPAGTLNVGGSVWNVTTFTHSSGTVSLTNTGTVTLYTANTFSKLSLTAAGQTVAFPPSATTTIAASGLLTITGTSTLITTIKSSSSGVQWTLNNGGSAPSVSFADIIDGAVSSAANITASSSHDGGNNSTKWVFSATAMTWTGTTSTSWSTYSNWSPRYTPNVTDNVTVPGAVPNNPIVPATLTVNNLTVSGTLNNNVANTITINGNLSVSGTWQTPANSTVLMKTNAATVNSTATLGNLTIDPGASNSVLISTNALSISGNLAVSTGSFNMNGLGLTMSAAGQLSGTITNSGSAAAFNASAATVTLAGTASVTTNGGAISFAAVNALSAGSQDFTLNSGAGTMTLSAAMGATALGDVSLTTTVALSLPSITTFTGKNLSVSSGTLTQQSSTVLTVPGTTAISTGGSADATLTNSNVLSGALTVTNSRIFQVSNSASLTIASATVSSTGSFSAVSTGTLTVSGAITNGASSGSISLTGDNFVIGSTITAGSGGVTFTTATASQPIYLGTGGTAAGLSSAEINNVSTSGTLTIGNSTHTGAVQTDGALSITGPTGPVQILTSGASVTLGNAVTTPANLTIDTTQGSVLTGAVSATGLLTIGSAGANTLSVTAGAGINVSNTSNLAASFTLNNQNGSGNILAHANRNTTVRGSNLVPAGSFTFVNHTGTLGTANTITTTGAGAANISLTTPGLMTLANTITAGGTGYVSLNSAGVTQSGGTISSGSGLELAGTGTFSLTQSNTNGKIAANVTGNVSYTDTAALAVDTVNATSTFTTGTSNNTTISSGALTQVNAITTGTLTLTSSGAITLSNASNAVSVLGTVSRAGAFQLSDNVTALTVTGPLTAGTITNAVTISNTGSIALNGNMSTSGSNNISVSAVGITVPSSPSINAGSGTITINGGAGAIDLGTSTLTTTNNTSSAIVVRNATTLAVGNVSASGGSSARINIGVGADVTGAVTQTAATTLNMGTGGIIWSTGSTVTIGNGSNTIPILDTSTSNGASSVTTGGTLTVAGNVSTTNGNLDLTATGITLSANVTTGSGNLSLLPSATGVTQSAGALSVTGLRVVGTGTGANPFALTQSSNAVGSVAASISGGSFSLSVTGALAVGTVGATSGISTSGQNLVLTSTGLLTISQAVAAGAGSVYLTSAGAGQTASISTTGGLRLAGTGAFTLSNTTNSLTSLAIGVTGATSIYSTGAVNIGTVASGTGASVGTNNLTLNGTGAWTQSGGANISASGLELLGTGSYTFGNTTNSVSTIAGSVTNNVTLGTNLALSVGTVNTVGLTATNVTLTTSTASLSQTQKLVSSGTLSITGGTQTVDLTGSSANNFTNVSVVSAGALSLTDINGYTVTGSSSSGNADFTDTTGTITISGAVSTSGSATQNLHPGGTGDLQINATLSTVNGAVTLNPAGQIYVNTGTMFSASGTAGIVVSRPVTLQAATALTGSGGNIDFGAAATIDGTFGLSITASTGNVIFAAAIGSGSSLGAITIVSAANVAGNSTATSDAASVIAASLTQSAGTGTTRLSTVTLTGAMSLSGVNNVDLNGTIAAPSGFSSSGSGSFDNTGATITTTGTALSITGSTASGSILVGSSLSSGAGSVSITSNASTVGISAAIGTSSGNITVNSSGVTTISAAGDITTTGAGTVTFGNSLTGTLTTAGDITTGNATITFNRSVTLSGAVSVSTSSGAGDIVFGSSIGNSSAQNLTLTAGTGSIVFPAASTIGSGTALNAIVINSAANVAGNSGATANTSSINATSLTQVAGTGTSRFGNVATSGATGLAIATTTATFNGTVVASGGGPITVTAPTINMNGGTFTTVSAAQTYTASGRVVMDPNAAGTIGSGGSTISFNTPSFFMDDSTGASSHLISVSDDLTFQDGVYLYRGNLDISSKTLTVGGSLAIMGSAYDDQDADRGTPNTLFQYPFYSTFFNATTGSKYLFSSGGTMFKSDGSGLASASLIVNKNFYANGVSLNPSANWTLTIPGNSTVSGLTVSGATNGFGTGTGSGSYFARAFYSTIAFGLVDPLSGTGEAIVAATKATTTALGTDIAAHTNNGNTDGGSNEVPSSGNSWQGWAFNPPYIVSARTVLDNMIEVIFSEPLENGSGELFNALNGGANAASTFRFDGGSTRFTKIYRYTNSVTPDSNGNGFLDTSEVTQVTGATTDFGDATDPLLLWVDTSSGSWNTDAGWNGSAMSAGDTSSTNRMGDHRTEVPDIEVLKGLFFSAHGKNLLPNYGDNSTTAFEHVPDNASPMLTGVWAGRSPYNQDRLSLPLTESSLRQYDGHNFLHFRYSEPLDLNNAGISVMVNDTTGTVQAGIQDTDTVRSSTTFGAVSTTSGVVNVAGLIDFSGQIQEGGRSTGDNKGLAANANLIIRDISDTTDNPATYHGFTLFMGGFSFTAVDPVDSVTKRYWPAWFKNPSSASAGITSPVSTIPTVLANTGIRDAAGNYLEPSSVANTVLSPRLYSSLAINASNLGTAWSGTGTWPTGAGFSVATSAATDLAGRFYEDWDVQPPVFTHPAPFTSTSAYDLVSRSDIATGYLNRMEIHVQDDANVSWLSSPTSVAPYSFRNPMVGSGVSVNDGISPDGYNDPTTLARVISGIRDTSWNFPESGEGAENYLNEMLAFAIEDRSVENVAGYPARTDFNAALETAVDNTEFGGAVSTTDDPYFSLAISGATLWGAVSNMYMKYDETVGFVTDHAGNLLRSKSSIYAVERTAPFVELALAVVGKKRIFVQFNEPVFGDQNATTQILASSFSLSGGTTANIVGLEILERSQGSSTSVVKANLVLNRVLTANDIYELKLSVATNAVYDQSENAMLSGLNRKISDVGLGTVEPVYAVDDIINPSTAGHVDAVRDFTGKSSLTGLSAIQIQVQNMASSYLSLPIKLYYDINVDANELYKSSFWYPRSIPGLYLETDEGSRDLAAPVEADLEARAVLGQAGTNGLTTFRINPGDKEIADGAVLDFVLDAGGLPTATVTDPDDPTTLRPWKLGIGGIVEQRGGVTILNNVINPVAGDKTVIVYDLKRAGQVNVIVFTLDGSIVKVLQRNRLGVGTYTFNWDGTNSGGAVVARGLYMIRVVGPDTDEFRKVLVVKP